MGQTNSVKKMRRLILKTYALRLCCYYVLLYCYCIFYFYLALITVSEKWSCACLRNHAATLSGWFMSRLFQVGHGYVIFFSAGLQTRNLNYCYFYTFPFIIHTFLYFFLNFCKFPFIFRNALFTYCFLLKDRNLQKWRKKYE